MSKLLKACELKMFAECVPNGNIFLTSEVTGDLNPVKFRQLVIDEVVLIETLDGCQFLAPKKAVTEMYDQHEYSVIQIFPKSIIL